MEKGALYLGSVVATDGKIGLYPEKEGSQEISLLEKAKAKLSLQELNHADFIVQGMTIDDLTELEKSGYDIEDEQSKTIVTVVDKIKLVMLEGGNTDVAITGGLSVAKIEEMTGNRGIAASLVNQMQSCDLPITEEFVEDVDQACSMMDNLKPIGKESASYLLKNAQLPTISNVYKAEFAATKQSLVSSKQVDPQIGRAHV